MLKKAIRAVCRGTDAALEDLYADGRDAFPEFNHMYTGETKYGDAALRLARKIAAPLVSRPVPWASVGNDAFHTQCLGFEITRDPALKEAALVVAANLAGRIDPQAGLCLMAAKSQRTNRESLPRDSCSAALATNILIRLVRIRPHVAPRYHPIIESTTSELARNYLTACGNYFFTECLFRQLSVDWSVLSLARPSTA